MGANAGTAVPVYASGEVLTAARLNLTNCGVPVFSGTATRDAAFGGSGEKVLAEGQLAYLEDADVVQYYTGAAWATVGPQTLTSGLNYITGSSFTTATSVSLPNDTFTNTYLNYRVLFTLNALTADSDFTMRLRAGGSDNSTANYSNNGVSGATSFAFIESDSARCVYTVQFDVLNPKVAQSTRILGSLFSVNKAASAFLTTNISGAFEATTSFDSLSIISSVASSMTGTVRVYGYADS